MLDLVLESMNTQGISDHLSRYIKGALHCEKIEKNREMSKQQGCIKIELDDSKYSAPVPVIGLYIAAASLLCFLGMLFDIFSGFLHRKQWLPCRLFPLNSVTLTLLAVAAKLPVDLTTTMPSALDQLSKLSGTTFVCISMGFIMPSLGTNQSSECLTNLAALSILVVTVVVNICIQIRTGLIVLFKAEHVIIMCSMLLLLLVLWTSAFLINRVKDVSLELNKDLFTKGQGSMLQRLKVAYLYGYHYNPQFLLCKHICSDLVAVLSILDVVVILQAASKSLTWEFCSGVSDYGWSMWMIVVIQILTAIVGSLATFLRLFCMATQRRSDWIHTYREDEAMKIILLNPLLRSSPREICVGVLECLIMTVIGVLSMAIYVPIVTLNLIIYCLSCWYRYNKQEDIEEYKHLIHEGDMGLDEWALRKCVKDMTNWMEVSKTNSLNHLSRLLSRTHPSQQMYIMTLKDQVHPDQQGMVVSTLSIVLLVRIAQVSMPRNSAGIIVNAFGETQEILHFVDSRINYASLKNRRNSRLARAVWIGHDFSRLLPQIFEKATTLGVYYQTLSEFDRAVLIIKELKNAWRSDCVWEEVGIITDYINRREYSSIEDLYSFIEQLFVDMLHLFLAQLPNAIFKEITDSPAEEFDKRARVALKFLCQIESLEAHVQWSFPVACDISSLIS